MSYKIVITGDIKRQISELPGNIKPIARQHIAELSNNPRPTRSKNLTGHVGHYRIHVATHYRLVWLINDEDQAVEIEYIDPKTPDLYKTLGLERPDQ